MTLQLHGSARSSCSFRVRIALNLKGVEYFNTPLSVGVKSEEFLAINPQGLIPLLVDGTKRISQSFAILEYLEESQTERQALLPQTPEGRARCRGIALNVICDIQPLQNTRVFPYLEKLGHSPVTWNNHWICEGFKYLERMLAGSPETGKFCHGDEPTLADCCLIPQVWNAIHRYEVDMARYPTIHRIYNTCIQLDAFARAMPEQQPDFNWD